MRWLFSEYILKGIFLGLLGYVVLQKPDWQATGKVALLTVGGLALFLGLAAWRKLREGYRVKGRVPAFVLFLLLESPRLVYAGILLGLLVGALSVRKLDGTDWLLPSVGAGVVLGVVFWLLRHVANRWFRLGLSLALAITLVGGVLFALDRYPEFLQDSAMRTTFGLQLLLGIPIFYLLVFAGMAEESEVEIGAMCAALGLGVFMLSWDHRSFQSVSLVMTMMLYLLYTTRILPGLRVFKHVVRGISHGNIGRYRQALTSFRRALELDPSNTLARESMWSMHRAMDLSQLAGDTETLALVDLDLCMERTASLLREPSPTAKHLEEAYHLLNLVLNQKPAMRPAIDYWRAVAHTHERLYEQAAAELENVLDSSIYSPADPYRAPVLLPAWQLALTLHPELNRRVGTPQLAIPGRRMEAIACVERHLADHADDAADWELKRLLYSGLTEADYLARATPAAPDKSSENQVAVISQNGFRNSVLHFDYGYTQQLGLALINDATRWERGVEYLRIAACGMPGSGPTIFQQIAEAYQRAGNSEGVWRSYELGKRAGRSVGPKGLGEEDRQAYFSTVKLLGEEARAKDDIAAAIENYLLYTEYERSGVETRRILAELYERKGEPLNALRVTEQALLYDGKDKDLLEKKDKYYYSVMPQDLRAQLETMASAIDVDYCLRKAKSLLDYKDGDLDLVDWAQHLAELATVVRPENLAAKILRARALRRRGETDQVRTILEEVYSNKPETFATDTDEEAWFLGCRLLGEMYLFELAKPDLAIPCFNDFRKSTKSGADTMYKLGQAYEQLGDRVRAAKYYEHVTAYDGHPLAPDARNALYRLQSS